jgi:hypothetical protein
MLGWGFTSDLVGFVAAATVSCERTAYHDKSQACCWTSVAEINAEASIEADGLFRRIIEWMRRSRQGAYQPSIGVRVEII